MKDKRSYKKAAGLVFSLLFAVLLCSNVAEAGNNAVVEKNGIISVRKKFKATVVYSAADKKRGYTFQGIPGKISSGNKSVGTIKQYDDQFEFYPKKTGTVKVKYKTGGKNAKTAGTVKVVKFKQPFKSLKIDGKSYRKQVKGSQSVVRPKTSKSKVKLNYKLNPGWKVTRVQINDLDQKKKKAYSLKKGAWVDMYLKNKKRGEEIIVSVDYYCTGSEGWY